VAEEVLRLRATVVSDEALKDIRRIGREIGLVQNMGGKGAAQAATQWQALGKQIKGVGQELLGAVPALGGFGLGAAGAGVAAYKLVNTLGDIAKGILDVKNTSKDLGISTGALKAFSIEAQKVGIAPEAMTQSLKNFKRNTDDFANHMGNLRGQMIAMGAGPVLEAMNKATTEIDKLKVAFDFKEVLLQMDPTGVKAQRFFEMLGLGPDTVRLKWNDLAKTIKDTPLISDEQIAKAKAYNDKLIDLGSKWDDLKTNFGSALFPAVGEDLRTLNLIIDALNRMSNWQAPSWLSWASKGPAALGDYQTRFGHLHGFDPTGMRAQRDAEDRAAEQKAIDDAKTDAEREAARKAQEAGRWRRAEDVTPAAPVAPAGQSPEDKARLLQNQKILQSITPPTVAPAPQTSGWRHMLHLSAAEGDDFHQYISKASDMRQLGSSVGGALSENPAASATGATGNALMIARYWPQIRAMMMGGGGAMAGGIGAAGAVMWPKPAETGELPEKYWPKTGPGVSKIAFGGGDTGGGESGATRIIRAGVFQGMVDFKSYMQNGAAVSGGDGGGMITKASWGGTGGGGGGGGFGLGGGGGGAGGGLHSGGGFTSLGGGGSSGGGGASGTYGGGGGASAPLTGGGATGGGAGASGSGAKMSEYSPAQRTALLDAMQKHEGFFPGSRSFRNNNPGNIEYGAFAKAHGAIGSDGRFAKFPSYQAGRGAQENLLFESGGYKNLTLGQAINRWAPGSENNVPAYLDAMNKALPAGPNGQAIPTPNAVATGGRRLPNAKGVWGEERADPRIAEIVSAAAEGLPPGYKIQMTSAGRDPSRRGFHPRGMAEDYQIVGPDGKVINNRGWDETGMYTKLAQNAYGYQEKTHPELTGKFQWGGQFGTAIGGGGVPDLMHFDVGGRRGNYKQFSREAIGSTLPPTVDTARIDGAVGAQASSGSVNVTVNSNGTKAEAKADTDGKLFQPPTIRQHKQMQRTEDVGVNV
jgi:hypothetical protein